MPEADIYPLIWSTDPGAIADWAIDTLGLTESWRATGTGGQVEHSELLWHGGRVSINIQTPQSQAMGPSGIALRFDDRAQVDSLYQRAVQLSANISQTLQDSPVAYSFTVNDPDGNQWWVNAESGMLDTLRKNI